MRGRLSPVDPVGFRGASTGGLRGGLRGGIKEEEKEVLKGWLRGIYEFLGLRWSLRDGSRREGKGIGFRGD